MKICDMGETLGTLYSILATNRTYFEPLPGIPKGEARVLGVGSSERSFRVLWAGEIKDIMNAPLEYEVRVQLKCLYHQAQLRDDGCQGWSPVVFLTLQDLEQSSHRILLQPGNHCVIAAIGGCDCEIAKDQK